MFSNFSRENSNESSVFNQLTFAQTRMSPFSVRCQAQEGLEKPMLCQGAVGTPV